MFTLNPSEVEALVQILDDYLPRLRVEIHRTEFNREMRRRLEHQEELLSELRGRMAVVLPSTPVEHGR